MLKHVKLGPMNETGGTALLHMVSQKKKKKKKKKKRFLVLCQKCIGLSAESGISLTGSKLELLEF